MNPEPYTLNFNLELLNDEPSAKNPIRYLELKNPKTDNP
jgi:hypothetical protein